MSTSVTISDLLQEQHYVGEILEFTSYNDVLKKVNEIAKEILIQNPKCIVIMHLWPWATPDHKKRVELFYLDDIMNQKPFNILKRLILKEYNHIHFYVCKL